jgi:hypothetical protein
MPHACWQKRRRFRPRRPKSGLCAPAKWAQPGSGSGSTLALDLLAQRGEGPLEHKRRCLPGRPCAVFEQPRRRSEDVDVRANEFHRASIIACEVARDSKGLVVVSACDDECVFCAGEHDLRAGHVALRREAGQEQARRRQAVSKPSAPYAGCLLDERAAAERPEPSDGMGQCLGLWRIFQFSRANPGACIVTNFNQAHSYRARKRPGDDVVTGLNPHGRDDTPRVVALTVDLSDHCKCFFFRQHAYAQVDFLDLL